MHSDWRKKLNSQLETSLCYMFSKAFFLILGVYMGLVIVLLDLGSLEWYDYFAVVLVFTINGFFMIDLILHILSLGFVKILQNHQVLLIEGVI